MQRHNAIEEVATTQITVRATLEPASDPRPGIAAYVFDYSHRYIAHAALDAQATVTLPVPIRPTTRALYVLIGPDISPLKQTIAYIDVKRLYALEKQIIRQPAECGTFVHFQVG